MDGYRFYGEMASEIGLPTLNISEQVFQYGLPVREIPPETIGPIFMRDGFAFTGFRSFEPIIPREAVKNRRTVLLVRDPRDMFVSDYFSLRSSHVLPPSGVVRERILATRKNLLMVTIDEFVLSQRCADAANDYRACTQLIDDDWRVYRYADIIFRKREWLRDMATHLRLDVDANQLDRIAKRNDILPASEQPDSHIR